MKALFILLFAALSTICSICVVRFAVSTKAKYKEIVYERVSKRDMTEDETNRQFGTYHPSDNTDYTFQTTTRTKIVPTRFGYELKEINKRMQWVQTTFIPDTPSNKN